MRQTVQSPNEAKILKLTESEQYRLLYDKMGVTILKYLTRLGSYNLAKTVKVGICNLEGIFWNVIPILILLNRSVFLIGYIVYVALLL